MHGTGSKGCFEGNTGIMPMSGYDKILLFIDALVDALFQDRDATNRPASVIRIMPRTVGRSGVSEKKTNPHKAAETR